MFNLPIKLTQEELKFYDKNGYLSVENIFSPEECKIAIELFERHARISNNKEYKVLINIDREEEWSNVYKPKERFIHQFVGQFLLRNPSIITILETLQGVAPGKIVLMQSQFIYKKAGTDYDTQAWNPHQDGTYHGAPIGGTLTANINLTDQDRENGCLFAYPGSHKEGFLEPEKKKSWDEGRGNRPGHDLSNNPIFKEKCEGKEIDLVLKAGSVLFLHGGIIHGSHPNRSKDRDRPMLQAPYKTEGLPFIPGNVGKRREMPTR